MNTAKYLGIFIIISSIAINCTASAIDKSYDVPPRVLKALDDSEVYVPRKEYKEIGPGVVLVKCYVNTAGRVTKAEVISNPGYSMNVERIAINKAKRTKWKPAQKDGQAVSGWTTYQVFIGY